MFALSLDYVLKFFPGAKITVVYVPSPLSCYEIVSGEVSAESYLQYRRNRYDAGLVRERNLLINARVRAEALGRGMGFVDTQPAVRAAARERLLHGPRDWNHFNLAGYEAMMGPVVEAVMGASDGKGKGARP